jgi:dTDP-3-amino-3,4,6-trideoxy-alpha-D-glucose transaminase
MIPFIDLKTTYQELEHELNTAINHVLNSGWYILGKETARFEAEFAAYCRVGHAIGVASGTDALLLALKALGVGPGDEVITVAHTAVATVAAIELAGATPVFVDIDPHSGTIDPALIPTAVSERTRAIVPVHLYGRPADLEPILAVAGERGLYVLEDCAQAHGALYHGRPVGSWGDVAAFSFYPTKNLGAMGDGGAIVTADAAIAERVRMLRQYGWRERYISDIPGYNSRLDELQAAILRVKLGHLDAHNASRRELAAVYAEQLKGLPVTLPGEQPRTEHVYHLYVVQTPQREALQAHLKAVGIATAVHYPVPVHRQPAYHRLGYTAGSLPHTERAAQTVLSLPMHPHLKPADIDVVAESIARFAG